ncbi:proline-rich protein 12-like isoform X4 [Girardinichthys multiradiatus]|nr:proline-rich protein 12-like isoform X4 [Girardinichthys multiradiatus]
MNLISALESRGPQHTPSASSLLSQFRTPSWQPTMHTPGPAELFMSGAIPGSGSYPSSSSISTYQHPGTFSGRSFTPSLSLQDTPTYSPNSNGLLSPHDSLLHIKTPSQSSLGFDRLLSSQSVTYRGSQDPPTLQNQTPSNSSNCHLPPPQFNLLSSQLHNRSSQLYNSSMFSSAPALVGAATPQPQPAPERAVPRQDSVIKHYQRSTPAQPTSLQQYTSCGGSSRYQQLVNQHRHVGMPCSPLDEQSPSADPKPSPQMEPQTYQPTIQTPYTTSSPSSSVSSLSAAKGPSGSSSNTIYSSSGSSSSSSRTPHTLPSTSSSSSSSSKTNSNSLSAPSHQQPGLQLAPAPPKLPVVSSTLVQQPAVKQCLSSYGSQSLVKSSTVIPNRTPPQSHAQSYSPTQVPSAHMAPTFGGFNSPHSQDLSSRGGVTGGKDFNSIGQGGRSFSAEIVYGDATYSSASLRRASSPSLDYGNESTRMGPLSGGTTQRGGILSVGSGSATSAVGNESNSSYHLPESSTSPVIISTLSHSTLPSPAAACTAPSPGSSGGTKYLSSILSSAFMSSPQTFPDTRQTQSDSYNLTPTKPKTDTKLLPADRSQVEAEGDDDFLIQHLLHTQRSTTHSSQHHSHSQILPQCISLARDGESKQRTFDNNKLSNERYHPQSVIRTNNTTSHPGPESTTSETASGLNRQLESTQKKKQTTSDLTLSKSPAGEVQGVSKSLSHSLTNQTDQEQHDSLGSVVQYGRMDPYTQHPHHQHSYHISHVSPYSQQHTQDPQQSTQHSRHNQLTQQHSQHSQTNSQSQNNPHMDLKKHLNTNKNAYLCNTLELLQAQQIQPPLSLTDSSPDPSQSTDMMQPVLSHTPCTKMDLHKGLAQQQQQQQPHHPLSQQDMICAAGGVRASGMESNSQNLSPQLPVSLQNQGIDTHYRLATQSRDELQTSQNSMPTLDMLDQSLSQTNNIDTVEPLDRTGLDVSVLVGEGGGGDRYRHQHRLTPQHHSQQKHPDLHNLLAEPDLCVSTPSHFHHVNPPPAHTHSHVLQGQQTHTHQQLSHEQLGHRPHGMSANMAPPHHLRRTQPREHETRLSHSQLDQLKQQQFDTISPANKVGLNQVQQQQRFPPLASICFPDSLLQDEDRSFFPEMEDMFCSTEYKSSCAGDSGEGQAVQENLSQSKEQSQEGIDALKVGGAGEGYDVGNHHTDQGYGQYCHTLPRTGNNNLHFALDSLKTHELPSTVNTDQLGLIQSQTLALGSAAQGDGTINKMMGGVGGSSSTTGLSSPMFCSSRPKKLLKTSSFHLLKQRREPQPQTKKNYPQEYEFEDDEDKADAPADIRLNSRRLPDLLPDLVSSCRRATSATGLSPMLSDVDFCHPSSYNPLGHHSQILPHDGPKKRGRKPTKPKREGPPRPRGRPRIRPLPEPAYCRGLMGSASGETRRGRGRGRGRGRREEGLVETHRDINKARSFPYNHQQQHQQQYSQQQHVQQHPQQHYNLQTDLHQVPHEHMQHHLHLQQQVSFSHHQVHHQQLYQQEQQQAPQQPQQDSTRPIKMKQLPSTMPPSESLLKTDSLSSSEPVLSDGSVGSAPSLGISPGPSSTMDIGRNDQDETQDKMMVYGWKKEMDHPLNPESWADLQKLSNSADDKDFDFKPGFMASFLDFLKTGKKESDLTLGHDEGEQEAFDACSSLKGGIGPLSSPPFLPPTSPQPPPETFNEHGQGEAPDLALSGCPSPCKPLDEELKRNLETLPSFSSDEEDSVSKNQDLQKSISSAISALYDTPHSLAAVMASAMIKTQPSHSPPTPQEPLLSPPLPAIPPVVPTVENIKKETLTYSQQHTQGDEGQSLISPQPSRLNTEKRDSEQKEEEEREEEVRGTEIGIDEEIMREPENLEGQEKEQEEEVDEKLPECLEAPKVEDPPSELALAPAPPSKSPSVSPSPPTYSSPSPLPPFSLSVPSSLPKQQGEDETGPTYLPPEAQAQPSSYHQASAAGTSPPPSTSPPAIPSSPLSSLPQSIPPPSTTPPPSSSDQDQDHEAGEPSPSSPSVSSPSSSSSEPPSPPTPEETPASQRLTSLHLAKKQADAAIAGESEEEDSESGGEGIFRERDEFVVRTEDIGTLKMALQTGREPPPIWRVQKALLQKFSPEIKDGQRQFCATSNYLGYFGDAKMCYQRLYVKFLENVNKKDYVRVCSRKPWHRAGQALRRQSLAKQVPSIHSQRQPRVERDDRDKERQKERELKEQRAREKEREREQREKIEKELKERERREEKEKHEREHKEKENMRKREERQQKQREFSEKEREIERVNKQKEREGREKENKDRERREYEREQSEREQMERRNREQREKEKREQEWSERLRQEREQKDKEQKEREKGERREISKQERDMREKQVEQKEGERRDVEKEKRQGRDGTAEILRLKEKREGEKNKTSKDRAEPPPKKRKKWLKEVPSSSSESDSSRPSEDEGLVRGGVNSRAMREMFRSYVEMLVSTALDPDMIQALEDTNDELYLPPMRKIDSLLSAQKKRLLRRVNMSAQHQEALHMYPKMTAGPLESGAVRVHLGGEGYSRKTLSRVKKSVPKQQDMKLSIETCRIYNLYHSLHHYKYHTFLHCKKETDNIEQAAEDPGQEEVVQQCMANQAWLESLFSSFIELLTLSAKA